MTSTSSDAKSSKQNPHFEKEKRLRGEIKHNILRTCTDGWLPCISGFYNEKLTVYVDGFAGPGKHKNGDIGSPLLICDALARHKFLQNFAGILLIFTEKDEKNYKQLVCNMKNNLDGHNGNEKIDKEFIFKNESDTFENRMKAAVADFKLWRESASLSLANPKIFVIVEHGEFNELMKQILQEFADNPMFIFADPFGWNVPMETFHAILKKSNSSAPKVILINLMDGNVRRWITSERSQASLQRLVGGDLTPPNGREWRHLSPSEKLDHIYELYIQNMRKAFDLPNPESEHFEEGGVFMPMELLDLKFAIRDKNNAHVYHLVFLCTHIKSLKTMKYAMYRNTQDCKDFTFSEWTKRKVVRDIPKERQDMTVDTFERIKVEFRGRTVKGSTLQKFIWEQTPFYFNFTPQLKKIMADFIEVKPSNRFEDIQYKIDIDEAVTETEDETREVIMPDSLQPSTSISMPTSNGGMDITFNEDAQVLQIQQNNILPRGKNRNEKRQLPSNFTENEERGALKRRNV